MTKTIQVHKKEVLLSLDAIDGLAVRLAEMPETRRKVPDALCDVLHAWIAEGGTILDGDGVPVIIYPGIVDDAHGEDGSFKWISEMRKRTRVPARRRPRMTMLDRMILYDAYFRLETGKSIILDADEVEQGCREPAFA